MPMSGRSAIRCSTRGCSDMPPKKKSDEGKRMDLVERRVMFYRVNVGFHPSGKPIDFPAQQAADIIRAMSDNAQIPLDRKRVLWHEGFTSCWVTTTGPQPEVCFGALRNSNLPMMERSDIIQPLPFQPGDNLAEQSYLVLFADNVVGMAYNWYGCSASRIAAYLRRQLEAYGGLKFSRFEISPLARADIAQRLEKLGGVRYLEFAVRQSHVAQLDAAYREGPGTAIMQAVDSLRGVGGEVFRVTLSAAQTRHDLPGSHGIMGWMKHLIRERKIDANQVSTFKVKGFAPELHRIEEVNLLEDHIFTKKKMVREDEGTRAVNAESAYKAIREAYQELRDEIRMAPTLEALPTE